MTYIMTAELQYCVAKVKALSDEAYFELRRRWPGFDLPEDKATIPDWMDFKAVGLFEDIEFLDSIGLEPRISRIRGQFADKLPKLGVPEQPPGLQVVNITIPNAGLFSVRRMTVVEDACTTYVQSFLDKGWRLIAVCPPNDTRRPTYVLGHENPGALDL